MTLHIIVFITSLVGDSIILIGTIKYKAIKQRKVIIAAIQHLAVLDILTSVLYVLPKTVTLMTDRWDFWPFLCLVYGHFFGFYIFASSLITCLLPVLKLITVKYPLRTGAWSSKMGHKFCFALYFCSIILISPFVILDLFFAEENDVIFTNLLYRCGRIYKSDIFNIAQLYISIGCSPAVISSVVLVPMIAASIALLIIAKKSASRFSEPLKWEGVAAIVLTVLVYVSISLPSSVMSFQIFMGHNVFDNNFYVRISGHLLILNIMVNFFIYCLFISSFREFIKLKIFRIFSLRS